jgi:hypothetical protein
LSGTIVGVAHDFAYAQLDGEARAELYYPWQRSPTAAKAARVDPVVALRQD